jgi:hypothetical protein
MKGTFAIAWTEGQVRAPGGAAAQQVLPPDTEVCLASPGRSPWGESLGSGLMISSRIGGGVLVEKGPRP